MSQSYLQLENEEYEEIKRVVADTFVEYQVKTIPISAFELAVNMGITVVPYSALSEAEQEAAFRVSQDGYSAEFSNGDWVIYYNNECNNYGRINQTIMHEIGHYALGHIKEGPQEEAEAKFFAKYALAPPPLIHNIKDPINTGSLIKHFGLSSQAAQFACRYYSKWLRYGDVDYTDYEKKILNLFKIS